MSQKPNIIFIISHDTGRYISPYGRRTVNTPNFERLAADSVQFDAAFTTAPQCCPSRGALFTGRYPQSNGLIGMNQQALNPEEKTIGHYLRDAGYATWLLGLQHEDPPNERDSEASAERLGFDYCDLDIDRNWLTMTDYLDERLESHDEGPFYCQVGTFLTHRPFNFMGIAPDDSKGVDIPSYLAQIGATGPAARQDLADFQGMVKTYDKGIGRILDWMDQRGISDNTILVVTTDHGEAFPRAKGSLYDPGIETLLFMRFPERGWSGGRRVSELVSNVDILPTLLEACEVNVPDNVQGRSFLPLFDKKPDYVPRDEIFAQKTLHDCYDPMRSVRTSRYKLTYYFEYSAFHAVPGDVVVGGAMQDAGRNAMRRGRLKVELFDLYNDPVETRNLADNPDYSEIRQDLSRRLFDHLKEIDDPILKGAVAGVQHDEVLDLLKGEA